MSYQVELVYDAKATLGEGPCWDADLGSLYWVDILEKKIHFYQTQAATQHTIEFDQYVGAVVLDKENNFLLAMQHGFYIYNRHTKLLRKINDPESHLPNNRFNDGKCDPAGRFWAGTMSFDETLGKGSLYVLDNDLTVRQVLNNLTISNGMAWSPDNTVMYFIDTPTRKITAYDFDLHTGSITNGRTVIAIPKGDGSPDGMTIDREGMLWVAHWGGYKVSRWDPTTGQQLTEIPVPAKQVTSCTFAGEDLDELYITSARVGLSEKELADYPLSGGLFKVKLGVKGTPSYKFGS